MNVPAILNNMKLFCIFFLTTLILIQVFAGGQLRTNTFLEISYMQFSENVLLSTDDGEYNFHVEPSLALGKDGVIYAGWKDAPSHNGGGFRVSYTYFDGIYWQNPQMMPQTNGAGTRQSDPWMVSLNGHLYYSYLEFSNTFTQVTLADTNDLGENWNIRSITDSQGFADKQTLIVREDGDMFLAYNDVGIGMRLSSSFDNGESFEDVMAIQDIDDGGTAVYILAGEVEDLFVFWSNYGENDPNISMGDIIFDKSSDSGQTWGVDTDINPGYNASVFTSAYGGVMIVSIPTAVYDSNKERIYVSWSDVGEDPESLNFNAFMRYSDDEGETWSDRYLIDEDNGQNQWHPDMVLDSKGNVQIVYYDNSTEGYKLKHRTYFPDNDSFSIERDVASEFTPGTFTRPGEYFGLEIDGNDRIHVIWADGRNDEMDILYSYMDLNHELPASSSKSDKNKSPVFDIFLSMSVLQVITKLKKHRK